MAWVPRTTAPTVANPYYRHTGYFAGSEDGLNECIVIDTDTGFVMPNCVGYAWGRWYEALRTRPMLSRGNAQDWYFHEDAYERGWIPRIGAIACFSGGSLGVGHVAPVEYFLGTNPVTSNSAYQGTLFWTEMLLPDPDTGGWITPQAGYTFQGFIYPPFIPEDDNKPWLLKMAASRRLPNGRDKNIHLWR
jgi:hypothetical protein